MRTAVPHACAVFLACLPFLFYSTSVFGQDMRRMYVTAQEARALLEKKAAAEKEDALREARQEREFIVENRGRLQKKLAELKRQNNIFKADVAALSEEAARLEQKETVVSAELDNAAEMVHELVGVVRINAKDINSFVEQNPQTALFLPDTAFLQELLEESQFPGMDDVRRMVEILKDQISKTGWVVVKDGRMVGRDGRETLSRILLVGPFTAAYRHGEEAGFLTYSAAGRKFYAISKLPPSGMADALQEYMDGASDDVPVDISCGAAVRELTASLSLWEQIRNGGPIVWPILGVFAAGIFIMMERVFFLMRRRVDSDALISGIESAVSEGMWDSAVDTCRSMGDRPLARVMLEGMDARNMGREEMENALQEAILSEIPSMERFLSSLGMLAAIAPLLGLLGTVTGMINTFHVITLHGTGDPRLMSAGISEALVTTMLGLSAAIPLLMGHNLLGGVVERRIADMEEKAVTLVNIILKTRENGGRH